MELTVYRQSSKTRPDGTIVYKGEDARPYVDDKFFMVADGLGGAAAIRHQSINPDMFDEDKIIDVLFKDVYDDCSNEQFVKYVKDSFFELFAVKDCYTDNIQNIKKSGYFASRIVCAIVLHEMLYNEKLSVDKLFEAIKGAENQEKKDAILSAIGNHFAKIIRENLQKVAKNANLIYETSYSGLALLGTTLCATLYFESDSCVDTIYLTAGDSRPYVWNSETGLMQVIEDQEGKDGGMTNYIRANEDAEFYIRCNHYTFNKPCMLYNASDGCFDSGYFLNQLAFEKLILESAVSSSSTDEMSQKMTEFFLEAGKHDDSSTISMKFFGFDSFGAFCSMAAKRLEQLQNDYLSEMPDVLEKDYRAEYEECAGKLPVLLQSLKERFEAENTVRDYCIDQVKTHNYLPYDKKITEIDEKIASLQQRIRNSTQSITDMIAGNFERFLPILNYDINWYERHRISRIQGIEERRNGRANDYMAQISLFKIKLDKSVQDISILLNKIYEIGVPSDFSDYDEVSLQVVDGCEASMDELFDFFNGLRSKKLSIVKKLAQEREKIIEENKEMAFKRPEMLAKLIEIVVEQNCDLSQLGVFPDYCRKINNERENIKKTSEEIEILEKEEKKKIFVESVDEYWNTHFVQIIDSIISSHSINISDELMSEAHTVIDDIKYKADQIKAKADVQVRIFEKYDAIYEQYLRGATK